MSNPKRVGLFGGTFNPIHIGHLIIAETALESLELDKVIFAPAGSPPHKNGLDIASAGERFQLVELAIATNPRFEASRIDLQQSGPSFTWQLLERLHELHPGTDVTFLMGADSLVNFETWKRPERILELARIGIADRPGNPIADEDWDEVPGLRSRVDIIPSPMCDISSTDIRERIAAGKSIRYLVPDAVRYRIQQARLYSGDRFG